MDFQWIMSEANKLTYNTLKQWFPNFSRTSSANLADYQRSTEQTLGITALKISLKQPQPNIWIINNFVLIWLETFANDSKILYLEATLKES